MSENKTQIFRTSKTSNYTIVNNEILRRKDLSWKAKGMLVYILSLPDDWVIYLDEVVKHATDGKDSFRSGWKELEEAGYVQRKPIREKGIIREWRTYVSENADLTTISPDSGFPEVVKPEVVKPQVDNQKLLSTYSTNDLYLQITKDIKKDTSSFQDDELTSSLIDLKDTGNFLLKYYANTYLEVKGKKHPKVPIDQISELIVGIEEVELRDYILDYEQIPELIDYHFDNLPSNNDGKIYAFNHLEYKNRITAEFLEQGSVPF